MDLTPLGITTPTTNELAANTRNYRPCTIVLDVPDVCVMCVCTVYCSFGLCVVLL